MRYINHLSDFQVIINIKDKEGNIVAPPSIPWEAVFADENGVEFKCYFDGTNYTHCIVDFSDIVCFVDNPGFSCGNLRCTFCQHVPSAEYCDGVMDLSQPLKCDIMLSKRESDDSTPITIEASPNWVRGPQGEQGIQGPQGIKGEKGDKGEKGEKGDTGEKGDKGEKGEKGDKGDTGAKGDRGEKGDQGERGLQGVQGVKGDDGVSPTVSTSKTGKVTTIEITDANGVHTATVLDGESVEVVQSTGTSTTAVMSQKASTDSFIANTPSGDPMHYMYECVGGVYNDTGSDVVVSDPIVGNLTHKAGCWWCTGLGDLTNDDMRKVYGFGCNIMNNIYANSKRCYNYSSWRTTCTDSQQRYIEGYITIGFDISYLFCFSEHLEIIRFANTEIPFKNIDYAFYWCVRLRYIYHVLSVDGCSSFTSPFGGCFKLTNVKIRYLNSNIDFKDCSLLNIESIIYMIENATEATITITLNPEAYERAIADAGVQTALANKTNVSLAKAE